MQIASKTLLAAAFAATATAAPLAAQELTLKFHSFIHSSAYQQKKFFEPWCARIEEQSGGRMACQIYPSMQLGGAPGDLLNQARDGIVDIVYANPGYSPGAYLTVEIFELPFMLRDTRNAARGMWDFLAENPSKELDGVRVIAVAPADFTLMQTKSREIRTLEDMKGLKMRSSGRYGAKALDALGAIPVQMPAGEITEALNRGVLDGAFLSWSGIRLLNLGEVMKHFTDFSEDQQKMYTPIQMLAIGEPSYQRLPDDLKKIIDDNSGREQSAEFADAFASTATEDRDIIENAGGDIYILPDDEYERWKERTQPIIDEWIADANAKGLDGEGLLKSAREALARYE